MMKKKQTEDPAWRSRREMAELAQWKKEWREIITDFFNSPKGKKLKREVIEKAIQWAKQKRSRSDKKNK